MPSNKRSLAADEELSKSSAHQNNAAHLDDLFAAIASTAADIQERNDQKDINKIMLVNKDTMVSHHGTIMANFHKKRSKPRRQSGFEMASVTEDSFKITRPFLPRDDSVILLKYNTTNAIPMIVPLAPADDEIVSTATNTSPASSSYDNNSKGEPLSRIPRRRKARCMSGVAVAGESRPVLIRDDSVLLLKKKLAGMVPLTYELATKKPTICLASIGVVVKKEEVISCQQQQQTESPTVTSETDVENKEEGGSDNNHNNNNNKPAKRFVKAPPGRSKTFHHIPRLTMRERQKGFVRKNSFTPACA